ncbi:MAG: hypothetical protein JXQ75_02950 [Phycisphaerae bacterium]|nr:hypothetical protein [Phycisphaerae bacterium]
MTDVVLVLVTYVLADVLRCTLWMQTSWPEVVPDHGSTIRVHLRMLVLLAFLWPLILRCLRWHEPAGWPMPWLVRRAVAASLLLVLSMAAYSMLLERGLYPRAQIAFLAVLLPGATVLARRFLKRARGGHDSGRPRHESDRPHRF